MKSFLQSKFSFWKKSSKISKIFRALVPKLSKMKPKPSFMSPTRLFHTDKVTNAPITTARSTSVRNDRAVYSDGEDEELTQLVTSPSESSVTSTQPNGRRALTPVRAITYWDSDSDDLTEDDQEVDPKDDQHTQIIQTAEERSEDIFTDYNYPSNPFSYTRSGSFKRRLSRSVTPMLDPSRVESKRRKVYDSFASCRSNSVPPRSDDNIMGGFDFRTDTKVHFYHGKKPETHFQKGAKDRRGETGMIAHLRNFTLVLAVLCLLMPGLLVCYRLYNRISFGDQAVAALEKELWTIRREFPGQNRSTYLELASALGSTLEERSSRPAAITFLISPSLENSSFPQCFLNRVGSVVNTVFSSMDLLIDFKTEVPEVKTIDLEYLELYGSNMSWIYSDLNSYFDEDGGRSVIFQEIDQIQDEMFLRLLHNLCDNYMAQNPRASFLFPVQIPQFKTEANELLQKDTEETNYFKDLFNSMFINEREFFQQEKPKELAQIADDILTKKWRRFAQEDNVPAYVARVLSNVVLIQVEEDCRPL